MKIKFIIFSLLLVQLNSCSHKEKPHFNSIVFTEYGQNAYSEKSNKAYLNLLKNTELKTVSLLFTCHTENRFSNDVDCQSSNSPEIKKSLHFLESQKKQGFRTSLRIYIDLLSGEWRAYWDPKDKAKAFHNIEKEILNILSQTSSDSIDLLVIGAEYENLTQPRLKKHWVELIKKIRLNYKGLITYGANTNLSTYTQPELHWVPFWSELDYIGLDYYFPVTKNKDNITEHSDQLLKLITPLEKLNKKIFINEIGVPLAEKGYTKPYEWKWPKNSKESPLTQANYLNDFFRAAKLYSIEDIHVWRFMPNEKDTFPFGYYLENLETLQVLRTLSD